MMIRMINFCKLITYLANKSLIISYIRDSGKEKFSQNVAVHNGNTYGIINDNWFC
jgi:hypothetical protein